jgi:uncharacterized repeat protein (TIGR01451 family)
MQLAKIKCRVFPTLFLLVMVASAGLAFSQSTLMKSAQPVKVNLSGAVERKGGKVAMEKAGTVSPGEVIDYTITSSNSGTTSAREYKTVGPIPARTVYVDGSARAEGASTMYSIDGSKSFSPKPMIDERQPDGTFKKVAAPVSMYTHVRFEWNSPLTAESHNTASYQVRVK